MKSLLAACGMAVAILTSGADGAEQTARTAQSLAQRYGYQVDQKRYPQGNPQATIRSIAQATQSGDVGYMVAHLISPQETDRKFQGDMAKFQRLTKKATPEKSAKMVESLRRHLEDGIWTIWRNRAWSQVDGTLGLSLENVGGRWFMDNTPRDMRLPTPRVAEAGAGVMR